MKNFKTTRGMASFINTQIESVKGKTRTHNFSGFEGIGEEIVEKVKENATLAKKLNVPSFQILAHAGSSSTKKWGRDTTKVLVTVKNGTFSVQVYRETASFAWAQYFEIITDMNVGLISQASEEDALMIRKNREALSAKGFHVAPGFMRKSEGFTKAK